MCRLLAYATFDVANQAAAEAPTGALVRKADRAWHVVAPCRKGTLESMQELSAAMPYMRDVVDTHHGYHILKDGTP